MKSGNRYLFVTGCYRSGTTLLARVLNFSQDVRIIAGETHFLGHLFTKGVRQHIRKFAPLTNDDNLRKAVDFMYSLPSIKDQKNYGAFWDYLADNVDKNQINEQLLNTDRSEKEIFKELLRIYGRGHKVIGEKTPSHVYHIDTLLSWFPDAKIVNIIRDPRAIFSSEYKRKIGTRKGISKLLFYIYKLLHVSITWNYICFLHKEYQKKYKNNYYFIKFEDMVSDPETSIKNICLFLEIPYDVRMLKPTVTNTSFDEESAHDKSKGFATTTVDRWEKQLNFPTKLFFRILCSVNLKKLDYIAQSSPDGIR